jgi:hypothetical protein
MPCRISCLIFISSMDDLDVRHITEMLHRRCGLRSRVDAVDRELCQGVYHSSVIGPTTKDGGIESW